MLDRRAMSIPSDRLPEALEERIHRKQAVLEERQKTFGDRIYIHSYMENIGWPELFGYDMNRVFSDAAFAMEMELRQRIFWADNSLDDALPGLWMQATVGMYYDITLFGEVVTHTPQGVPLFGRHPIADTAGSLADPTHRLPHQRHAAPTDRIAPGHAATEPPALWRKADHRLPRLRPRPAGCMHPDAHV